MKRLLIAIPWTWLAFSGCRGTESDLPRAYRRIEVPAARLESPAAQARGRRLFLAHCALCHGENADGRGVRREGLARSPRDFTDASWRRQATPRKVYFAIREGLPPSGMPSWKSLEEEEAWDLTAYLLSVAGGGDSPKPVPHTDHSNGA